MIDCARLRLLMPKGEAEFGVVDINRLTNAAGSLPKEASLRDRGVVCNRAPSFHRYLNGDSDRFECRISPAFRIDAATRSPRSAGQGPVAACSASGPAYRHHVGRSVPRRRPASMLSNWSGWTGLTRCKSNPAAAACALSDDCPQPVMAMRCMPRVALRERRDRATCEAQATDAEKRVQPIRKLVLDPSFFGHGPEDH